MGSDSKQFRPTLCIVNRQPEDHRSTRGKNTSEIMADRTPFNVPPQKLDSGAEHHLDVRIIGENTKQLIDSVQGRSQIGVPETDTGDAWGVQCMEHPLAYRFSLARVLRQMQNLNTRRHLCLQALQNGESVIGTAVVDK